MSASGGGQTARWDFPGNGPASWPTTYSFIYRNVGVISLDANDVSHEIPHNLGYSQGSQTSWLKRRLAYLRAQHTTCGAAGRSLYAFPAPDSYAGHEVSQREVPSYYWAAGGQKVTETVTWSRVRYTGYAFIALDVKPGFFGGKSTITVRCVTNHGQEIDRFVIERDTGLRAGLGLDLGGDIGDL